MSSRPAVRFALCCVLLSCGCAGVPRVGTRVDAPPTVDPVGAALAHDNLNAVAWTQASLEHDLVYLELYRTAMRRLDDALADRSWDALPHGDRDRDASGLAPAVILDIDETVLDNSPYQARLIRDGREYDEFSWSQWCREKAARPLPGALEFVRRARALGVAVYYLSNRAQDLNEVTLDNLRGAGFPLDAGAQSMFLGLGTVVAGCEQSGTDKGCRRRLVGTDHRVLLQIGDQLGDFVDVPARTPQAREAALAPYAGWIGERWIVLPNPTYGSWQAVLKGPAGTPEEHSRRQAIRDALRY